MNTVEDLELEVKRLQAQLAEAQALLEDTQEQLLTALDENLKGLAQIAGAYRAAAEALRANRLARLAIGAHLFSSWEQGYTDGLKWAEDDVVLLTPADAALEVEIAKAEAAVYCTKAVNHEGQVWNRESKTYEWRRDRLTHNRDEMKAAIARRDELIRNTEVK